MSSPADPRPEDVAARVASVPHWHHRIEVAPGVVTPGGQDSAAMLALLPLPDDMRGMRVLDIGARDGFFSFEMERRGAQVLALDYVPPEQTGFVVARSLLGSRVEYRVENVYGSTPRGTAASIWSSSSGCSTTRVTRCSPWTGSGRSGRAH